MVNSEIRLIIFFAAKDEGMQKQRPEAEYGSFHEFIIAQFILKLKKVGETIGQFWNDLNSLWLNSGGEKLIQGLRFSRQCAWRTMDSGL